MNINSITRTVIISGSMVALAAVPAYACKTTSHKDTKKPVVVAHEHKQPEKKEVEHKPAPKETPQPTPAPTPKPVTIGKGEVTKPVAQTVVAEQTPVQPATPQAAVTPQPTQLPVTGAGLSGMIGIPAMAVAGREYLRSRARRLA